jgi:hypothetical protein
MELGNQYHESLKVLFLFGTCSGELELGIMFRRRLCISYLNSSMRIPTGGIFQCPKCRRNIELSSLSAPMFHSSYIKD